MSYADEHLTCDRCGYRERMPYPTLMPYRWVCTMDDRDLCPDCRDELI